jgi:hypothetical protein
MVYPVVLGAGARLFGETQNKIPLRLVESRSVRGTRGEHELCTCHGERVMRTLAIDFGRTSDEFSDRATRVRRGRCARIAWQASNSGSRFPR